MEEVPSAKAFFFQQFADLLTQSNVLDASVQRQLWQWLQAAGAVEQANREPAEYCLRCLISHQIEQACVQLAAKFGARHGFTRSDLLPFVLDDQLPISKRQVSTSYRSLACQILQTFNPDKAGLSTWVVRQVRHHPELRVFLRERGVYLATDWGILNDTQPDQLRRILAEFHALTPTEIEFAYHLLRGYHAVYRHDRLQRRQLGQLRGKETCVPPTLDQLTRIADFVQIQLALTFSPEEMLSKLQSLAAQLRQYRLHRLGAPLPTIPIEHTNAPPIIEKPAPEFDPDCSEEQEFLTFYRDQVISCLDQALEQAINDRVAYLQRKNAPMVQPFLTALELFHCRGQSMGEIAPQVGLQAQYQVTRLMKLQELRASVRAKLLQCLLNCILDQAKQYTDPSHLQTLNQTLAAVLDEQISTLLQQAETEAAVAKRRPLKSLFARRLCHYLDIRKNTL